MDVLVCDFLSSLPDNAKEWRVLLSFLTSLEQHPAAIQEARQIAAQVRRWRRRCAVACASACAWLACGLTGSCSESSTYAIRPELLYKHRALWIITILVCACRCGAVFLSPLHSACTHQQAAEYGGEGSSFLQSAQWLQRQQGASNRQMQRRLLENVTLTAADKVMGYKRAWPAACSMRPGFDGNSPDMVSSLSALFFFPPKPLPCCCRCCTGRPAGLSNCR